MGGNHDDATFMPFTVDVLLATLDPDGKIRAELGDRKPVASSLPVDPPSNSSAGLPPVEFRVTRARLYLSRIPGATQGQNGSAVTYQAACAMSHGFALDDADALALLLDEYNPRCAPPWSEAELLHKVRDAASKSHREPRGYLAARERLPAVSSPAAGRAVADVGHRCASEPTADTCKKNVPEFITEWEEHDDDPCRIARYVSAEHKLDGCNTLAYWRGEFYGWDRRRNVWAPIDNGTWNAIIHGSVRRFLEEVQNTHKRLFDSGKIDEIPKLVRVTRNLVSNVVAAIESQSLLDAGEKSEPPSWIIGSTAGRPNAKEIIAGRNGLLHLPTFCDGKPTDHAILPPTPEFFNLNAVDFDLQTTAPRPVEWQKFLVSVWGDDAESVALLQEWFGYALTADTSRQKMLLMVGPRRSGKGTISRVLQQLVGPANCCGPTLSGLGGPFGLSPLLGKSLAVIEDARLSTRADSDAITERLLAISGEGTLSVERKYLGAVQTRLGVRFIVSTNELPRIADRGCALSSRWSVLQFVKSFEGKEDIRLGDRLANELPGIFLWAVEGWKRLRDQGTFTKPQASEDTVEAIEENGAPVVVFLRDRCKVADGCKVSVADLYAEWRAWCSDTGRKEPGTREEFGRQLRAAAPAVRRTNIRTSEGVVKGYKGVRILDHNELCSIDLFSSDQNVTPVTPFSLSCSYETKEVEAIDSERRDNNNEIGVTWGNGEQINDISDGVDL